MVRLIIPQRPVPDHPIRRPELLVIMEQSHQRSMQKAEQATREQIIKQWSQFSADDRRHCIAEATIGGESSYTELLTCLEMARNGRELHKQPSSLSEQNIPPAPVGQRQPMAQ